MPLLDRHAVSRVGVVGREARGVCRVGDDAVDDLLKRVDALAIGTEGVHEMHSVAHRKSV